MHQKKKMKEHCTKFYPIKGHSPQCYLIEDNFYPWEINVKRGIKEMIEDTQNGLKT